jgi:DNA-binding NtrC family response regulator
VPPLRERPGDVELLVRAFLDELHARKSGAPLTLTRDALRALASYPWPGNVRELRAEVMRWGVFCDGEVDVSDLAPEIRSPAARRGAARAIAKAAAEPVTLAAAVEAAERSAILAAIGAERGNLSRTARALGIDRNTLKRKLAAYAIAVPRS